MEAYSRKGFHDFYKNIKIKVLLLGKALTVFS